MNAKARWQRDLGQKLSAARADRSQAVVARLAEMHPNTLARIERGEIEPGGWALARLAAALGVSLDLLAGIPAAE